METTKVLLVVDYQKDFVDGTLGFKAAEDLDSGIAAILAEYLDHDRPVILTFDTHDDGYLNTQEGKKLPIPHCVFGTLGWHIYGKTFKAYNDRLCLDGDRNIHAVYKSTFGSLSLAAELKKIANEHPNTTLEITIVGVVTNMCVISNAIICKAALPECEINVIEHLCASNDEKLHNAAIEVIRSMQMNII